MTIQGDVVFVGAGNMANALIEGLLAAGTCEAGGIVACDVRPEALEALSSRHGVRTSPDVAQAVQGAAVVVLSTKPQVFGQVLPVLAGAVQPQTLVVSIAAGISISVIENQLGDQCRVVRAMPNTPALVRAGATAIAPGTRASDADMATAQRIFDSVGVTVRVQEALLDAVTGLSGSGPAYVFRMVEGLIAGGVRVGLSEADSTALAVQTVFGAAKLLRESGESAEVLRQRVSSPGGTTLAGLERLQHAGFADALGAAVERATERAGQLGEEARRSMGG